VVAVVIPLRQEPPPEFVDVRRTEVFKLATRAARNLGRELAEVEQSLLDEELARRRKWNLRWWVRLLPFLKADTSPESIDVWDVGGGDVLPNLDHVMELSWLDSHATEASSLATAAMRGTSALMPVEKRMLRILRNFA
jgi:hypothetical protein